MAKKAQKANVKNAGIGSYYNLSLQNSALFGKIVSMLLTHFRSLRPSHQATQAEALEWFASAYAMAGFEIREEILRVGCKPPAIEKRGSVIPDYLHQNWDKMEIYRLKESKSGLGLKERMERFGREADLAFETLYQDETVAPDDLIHVTCTGYVAPSAAQAWVSKKRWQTTVTHAYHMGCYGAFPAIRMGRAFLAAEPHKKRVDVVHTEICSLHSNPSNQRLDQIICQTLFADGFIRYEIVRDCKEPHLELQSIQEELIPNSLDSMHWNLTSHNFEMKLAKEIPVQIARALPAFLNRLGVQDQLQEAFFAVHPGGPRILQQIQDRLGLKDIQMQPSVTILREHGNMSSATVPHIWQHILENPQIPDGALIVSLAFGPGLTICGSTLVKRCGGRR